MRIRLLSLSLLTLLSSTAVVAHAIEPITYTTYTFHGVCGDCSNDPPAGVTGNGYGNGGNGILTLMNYVPGTEITTDNFVEFDYHSSILTDYDILADSRADRDYVSGELGLGTLDNLELGIDDQTFDATGGFWCTGNDCRADYGRSFAFTGPAAAVAATPEPASLTLLGTGFAGVMALYKRRR